MGLLLDKQGGGLEQVVEYFERAAAAEPDHFDYHAEAGYFNYQLGRYQASIKHYRKALTLPHAIITSMLLSRDIGRVYINLDDLEMAEKSFKYPLTINPYHLDSLQDLSMLYLNTGRQREACYYTSRAIMVAPESERVQIEKFINPTFNEQVQQRRPRLEFCSPGISWVCC